MRIPVVLLILLFSLNSFSQGGTFVPKKTPSPATTLPKQPSKKNPSQNSSSTLKTLIVSPETVPCLNNSSSQCLQVKKQGSTGFETIEDIENFNYDIGYTYTVQVKEIMKTPPIGVGESVFRYIWIKTISKKEFIEEAVNEATKDSPDLTPKTTYQSTYNNGKIIGQTNIITGSELDKKWYLRKLKNINGESLITDDNVMWIEIKTFNDRIEGFGSCNKFWTVVKSDLNTTFEVSKLTTNYAQCGYKKLEDMFYDLLQQANRFEIRNGNLVLSDQWKFLLGFTSNPDNKEDISITYTQQNIVKKDDITYATSQKSNTITNITEDNKIPDNVRSTTNIDTKVTNISSDTETIEMQRKIDEMQIALAAKKQKAADDAKLAADKEAELKQKDELKQKELAVAQAKAEKIAKLKADQERLQKELDEIDNGTISPKPTSTDITKQTGSTDKNTKSLAIEKPTSTVAKNVAKETVTQKTNTTNFDFSELKTVGIVYSVNEKTLISIENANATFKGSDKNTYLELETDESPVQFVQNKLPKFVIKLNDNESPYGNVLLYSCEFKKDKRQVYIRPQKNTIGLSFNELSKNIYEILLPKHMDINEYAFVTNANTDDFKNIEYNSSSTSISCFGVSEGASIKKDEFEEVKNTKSKDKNVDKSSDCKPDNINIDKITKEKTESWNLKLASSNVFADKANGKDQFIFYFQLNKIGNKQYFALVLQKTASMTSQILGNEYVFDKGNKVLFGLVDSKPYEMFITDVYKDKKIYESLHQVVTTHFLVHEITDEEILKVKDLLTNKNIDAIRIILTDGTFINKDVKENKSDILISKANCFFDALE